MRREIWALQDNRWTSEDGATISLKMREDSQNDKRKTTMLVISKVTSGLWGTHCIMNIKFVDVYKSSQNKINQEKEQG